MLASTCVYPEFVSRRTFSPHLVNSEMKSPRFAWGHPLERMVKFDLCKASFGIKILNTHLVALELESDC